MFPRYFSKKPTPVSAELLAQEFHDTINLVTDDQSKVIGFIPGITIGANEGRIAPVRPWRPAMTAMLSMIENQQDMYVVDEVLKAARKSYNREMGYLALGNIFSGKA